MAKQKKQIVHNARTLFIFLCYISLTIPSALGQLTNVSIMNLSFNQLFGSIPSLMGQLTNLRILSLSFNQLTETLPSSLGQITNLKWLNISSSLIIGTIPPSFGQITDLQWLVLSNNHISETIPSSLLGQLNNLQRLDLSLNQLTRNIPSSIGQLANLQYLDLSYNQLMEGTNAGTSLTTLHRESKRCCSVESLLRTSTATWKWLGPMGDVSYGLGQTNLGEQGVDPCDDILFLGICINIHARVLSFSDKLERIFRSCMISFLTHP